MARLETYENDLTLSLEDKVIGSDADNNNQTKNYTIQGISNLIIEDINGVPISSRYVLRADNLGNDDGVLLQTNATTLVFTTKDLRGINNTVLFSEIQENRLNLVFTVRRNNNDFSYYTISSVVDNGLTHTFTVAPYEQFSTGALVQDSIYTIGIDVAATLVNQAQSDWDEANTLVPEYIDNKPTIPVYQAGTNITIDNPTSATPTINSSGGGGGLPAGFYAEGTFTPTLLEQNVALSPYTLIAANGSYVRVGNKVFVDLLIQVSVTTGTPSGSLQVGGLPFQPVSSGGSAPYAGSVGSFTGSDAVFTSLTSHIISGLDVIRFVPNSVLTALAGVSLTSSTITTSGTYITDVYTP